jgi:thiamine-monophosphate kinase
MNHGDPEDPEKPGGRRRGGGTLLLRDLGEFGMIDLLRRRYGGAAQRGEIAIGDDAAVVRIPGGRAVLSTDMLLSGTHFSMEYFRPVEVGWRALSANLSDIAAMGAAPIGYLVALAAPGDTPAATVDGIFRGMARAAAPCGMRLMGGDTCRGDRLVLCLTVVGALARGRPLTRVGARPGDILYVTGAPGWSSLGLRLLRGGRPPGARGWRREALRRHLRPEARWREGMAAGASGAVSAMIDLSDGLLPDLAHLLERDSLGATLREVALPMARSFRKAAADLGVDPLAALLAGGEDYELLMAVRPDSEGGFRRASRAFPAAPAPIGVVTGKPGIRVRRADGSVLEGSALPRGFEHFPGPRRKPAGPEGRRR